MHHVPVGSLGRARHGRRLVCTAAALGVAVLCAAHEALAGDVTVTKKGHTVSISAADGVENILIAPAGGNVLRVSSTDGGGTTVQGGTEGFATVGPLDTVVVSLGNGSNHVAITGVLPKFLQLKVHGGADDDAFSVDAATLPSTLRIDDLDGAGTGSVVLANSKFVGKVVVAGGAGQDTFSATTCDFRKGLKVNFVTDAAVTDTADLVTCTAEGSVAVVGGAGNDSLRIAGGTYKKSVTINGGGGADTVSAGGDAQFKGPVILKGGDGTDQINVSGGPDFFGLLTVDGGADGDILDVRSTGFYQGVRILGGDGNDIITTGDYTTLLPMEILAGAGADSVTCFGFMDARKGALLDGGPGGDTITGGTLIVVPKGYYKRTIRGFETKL